MFSLGLEFSLRKLKQVGAHGLHRALPWRSSSCSGPGYRTRPALRLEQHGQHFPRRDPVDLLHHDHHQGARRTRAEQRSAFAQLIFGILIVEDILAIAMIALLSGIAMTGTFAARPTSA